MQHYKFNNDFLENLLNKIQTEKKFSILAGDLNLNLITYSKTTGINKFLEIILSNNFMPQTEQNSNTYCQHTYQPLQE